MRSLVNQDIPMSQTRVQGEVYIETGVQYGISMEEARILTSPMFIELHGIEIDPTMAANARQRFIHDRRVTIHQGSSLDVLPKLLDSSKTTIFWLDAHYVGGVPTSFHAPHGQNPLIEELRIIMQVPWRTLPIILIDDADAFCSDRWWDTRPKDELKSHNPTFAQIYDALSRIDCREPRYDFFICNHCIHCLPRQVS